MSQIFYLPLRRTQRFVPAALHGGSASLDEARCARLALEVTRWGVGERMERVERADRVVARVFRFLGREERIEEIDWSRRYVGHLWNYNLQYFDYGVDLAWAWRYTGDSRYLQRFQELAQGWVAGSPPGRGDGWEPYALSMRAINWSYTLLLFGDALDAGVRRSLVTSLHGQLSFLERRLERHILANHYLKNLQALALGALMFTGAAAERWRTRVGPRFWGEVLEQVLPDGGHFERSPMYHAIVLGDLLETRLLFHAVGEPVPTEAEERIRQMVRALRVLCRPDGTLHLFNDAANGIAPPAARLDELAARFMERPLPTRGPFALRETGYFGWSGDEERIVVDCGAPGPAYQPGHGHCDLLSFELDLGGRPVVADSGVSGYEGDPLREYVRSTRAHNTVTIDGREQSEVWGTFRMARRATVLSATSTGDADSWRFTGAYAPFHNRRARHTRTIARGAGKWNVTDRIEGARGARVAAFLHFHPDFEVAGGGSTFVAAAGDCLVHISFFGVDQVVVRRGEAEPAQGWYCPEFGIAVPAAVLEIWLNDYDGREFGYILSRVKPVLDREPTHPSDGRAEHR